MTDDIAARIIAGATVRIRDRREVADLVVDGDGISGKVPMVGPCHWHRDGRYRDAPGGGAGPLDLVIVGEAGEGPARGSVLDALADPQARNSCCD